MVKPAFKTYKTIILINLQKNIKIPNIPFIWKIDFVIQKYLKTIKNIMEYFI